MAKIQAVWAIDIGQAALKALKLVPGDGPDQVVAEAFDFIEYPKILSQPDADPDELVREALATFTDRNDIKGCKVAIAVPGQSGLVKFIKLPPVEKKRIPDIVKFEAKQQIPFALDEVVWAYQQIGGDDEGEDEEFTMAEVGLFAMKRDQINRAILPLTVSGIEVDIVQMAPIALYNYITFDQIRGSDSKDSVVLLDIGADNTDLIITDGSRIWQRNVPIGGNHFTRALTKELKLTFAKAEHLKRNATKAPDPRAIFTAMRGVFNDFASEVNRSIGFYGSVNRSAKIRKVVGLGNGFKLPGLQKFLQQNLNQEVERIEDFERMVGEEVKGAPQFQDNQASFAVAFGLGAQGLGRGGLSTNLLPPELERIRLVRAKKPWALAAAALIMLGLTFLFTMGDYRVLAKVTTPQFKEAVSQADNISNRGADLESKFKTAKDAWKAKNAEGEALVLDPGERAMWPEFLAVISRFFPEPEREYQLDPSAPSSQETLETLRVHIDAIKPVWSNEVGDWFKDLDPKFKMLMHPYDAEEANAPSGPGWIVQIICHHYNAYPDLGTEEGKKQFGLSASDPRRTQFGPIPYLTNKVLPKLSDPRLRLFGVKSIAVAWLTTEKEWTSEKGKSNNNLASNTIPLLPRATAPASAEDGEGGGMMGDSMMKGMMAQMNNQGQMAEMMNMDMMGSMAAYRGRMGMGMMGQKEEKQDRKTLTRTDFLLQFVWQLPKPEEAPKTDEERLNKLKGIAKALDEAETKNNSAIKASKEAKEDLEKELDAASRKKSEQVESKIQAAVSGTGGGGGAAPAPGALPGAGAAPTPGALPGAGAAPTPGAAPPPR